MNFVSHLIPFGKLGIISNLDKDSPKLDNKRQYHIMLSYTNNKHPGDVYQLYNMKTGKVIKLRDIVWSQFYFRDVFKKHAPVMVIGGDSYDKFELTEKNGGKQSKKRFTI